mmetsp:Transcript_21038/g.62954  ORF Transcript_21038/g.62954 Transcript_21038/m.62954 type:complete len:85 (-) Transcript_21038:1220-1474(-)
MGHDINMHGMPYMQLTQGIKNEVESQHSILDGMGEGMSSVKGMIGNVGDKFRMVLQDKANNKTIMAVVGGAVLLFFLWYFLHGR